MRMFINRLIEMVKSYPELYDPTNRDFKDFSRKSDIWKEIANELNLEDGEAARSKWRNLRDSYVKHLRISYRGTHGSSINRYKNWPWANQMEFLKKHVSCRWSDLNLLTQKNEPSSEDDSTTTQVPITVTAQESPPPIKRKRKSGRSSLASPLMPSENFQFNDFQLQDMDADDLLFLSYAKTLKTFNKRRQMLVKMEISRIMLEAEMVQATEDEHLEMKYEPEDIDETEEDTLRDKPSSSYLYVNECSNAEKD